jgi:hypothetical protein
MDRFRSDHVTASTCLGKTVTFEPILHDIAVTIHGVMARSTPLPFLKSNEGCCNSAFTGAMQI